MHVRRITMYIKSVLNPNSKTLSKATKKKFCRKSVINIYPQLISSSLLTSFFPDLLLLVSQLNYRSGMKICSAFFFFFSPHENQRISVIPSKLFITVLTWCKIITSHPFFHLGNVLNQTNMSFHVLSSHLLRRCHNTLSSFQTKDIIVKELFELLCNYCKIVFFIFVCFGMLFSSFFFFK